METTKSSNVRGRPRTLAALLSVIVSIAAFTAAAGAALGQGDGTTAPVFASGSSLLVEAGPDGSTSDADSFAVEAGDWFEVDIDGEKFCIIGDCDLLNPVSAELVWASTVNGNPDGNLDGASIDSWFDVMLVPSEGADEIERVKWFIDGDLYRNDDLGAPYNVRYSALMPVGSDFGSDQGLDGTWRFVPGSTHLIEAVVVTADREQTFSASFVAGPAAG